MTLLSEVYVKRIPVHVFQNRSLRGLCKVLMRTADGGRPDTDKINNKNQKTFKKYINKYKNNQLIIRKRKNMSKHPRKLVVYIKKKKLPCSTSAFLKICKPCKPIKCDTCYHFSLSHVLILNFTSSSRYQKICVIGVQFFFSLFVHYISSLQKLAIIYIII